VTDLLREYTQTDVSFVNSGFIRHDSIIKAGPFQVK
jgi:5'-nucleotidase/UDP-sugar diphosphatase